MGRHSYAVASVANGHAAPQRYSRDESPIGPEATTPREVVLDCRCLQNERRDGDPALLKELTEDGYGPRDRMVGWSCAFLAAGAFLLVGGGVMLALSLTLEPKVNSLTDYYDVPTTLLGAALLGLAAAFFLLALIKGCWHRHL
ncbi:uncharacterized protein LOC142573118 isoform X1 [Dermacentor variabilis]|uniref:uncharacterized protein LOC142573118 isoform X1 n=1 Tax=Dermacentor variabilis TaxID=34621 RepID=UPI003F5BE771